MVLCKVQTKASSQSKRSSWSNLLCRISGYCNRRMQAGGGMAMDSDVPSQGKIVPRCGNDISEEVTASAARRQFCPN